MHVETGESGSPGDLSLFLDRLRSGEEVPPREISEMVGRIHLNVSGLPGQRWFDPTGENGRVVVEIFREISKIAAGSGERPFSNGPLSFVASYPRSGNTMVLQSLTRLGGVQTFTDEVSTHRYMPFNFYPEHYPLQRIVKSHRVLSPDPSCRYVYIVRDGRDILPSIAYMSRLQDASEEPGRGPLAPFSRWLRKRRVRPNCHTFSRRRELADFIVWLKDNYRYGDWIDFHRNLEAVKGRENVLVVRYPDLIASVDALRRIADFLGVDYQEDSLVSAFEERDNILERLAGSNANEKWGLGEEFDKGSLYYAWSRNRAGSNWRESMDRRARRTFHEMGATPFLLDYGFETDPDWWRR